jgi:ribonucleoside-diphosphate reductase alpha chain
VTCIAPTGTISFLMDCDTTGVEPFLSLVQEKKLVGGGRLRLVARTLAEALARLGYRDDDARAIAAYVETHGSAEGAPRLRPEHLPVFDTAVASRAGGRALASEAHLQMMAALQPFVSGAISKTANLPAEATVEDVEQVLARAWRLGLKAVAVYRDQSKVAQPLAPMGVAPDLAGEVSERCTECGGGLTLDGTCRVCRNCGSNTGCA